MDSELVAFAHHLADLARAETMGRFAARVGAENKAGAGYDPVTEADREAERVMRAAIEDAYPNHGIAGEEWGTREGTCPWGWSLDPVDGTRAFVCGLPSWTTLIALLDDGRPVLGVIDAPVLGERAVGTPEGAWLNGVVARTSGCASLAEARLSTTDPGLFVGTEAEGWERVRRAARVTRYGLDAYAYLRLAAGDIDLVIENGLKPHDWQALVPVVAGAGGVVGDWRGGRALEAGAIVAAASRALYEEAVALLTM